MANINIRTILSKDGINKISHKNFVVKDYQRGYRWSDTQIKELLNDIDNFNSTDGKKYCLQPLVVKKIEHLNNYHSINDLIKCELLNTTDYIDTYELIDGQQRLTTILLIYYICYQNLVNKPNLPFSIQYQYIRNIDKQYIERAKDIINEWFEKFGDFEDDKKEEIRKKLNSEIIFIWYEVDSNVISNDIFSKINEGKIPLSAADLFKSLLLNYLESKDEHKSELISKEWDDIESKLNDDDFWYFIANDNIIKMNYILTIYASSKDVKKNRNTDDNLYPYYIIDSLVTEGEKPDVIWEEVVNIFYKLLYWYKDKELYHLIGFLIMCSKYNNIREPYKLIVSLMNETNNMTKKLVKSYIYTRIKKEFDNIVFDNLSYDNGKDIRKVLLYFNIKSIIKSKTENRFSFKSLKKTKWDIEHIHAVANEEKLKGIIDKTKRIDLLKKLDAAYSELGNIKKVKDIEDSIYRISEKTTSDDFIKIYKNILGNDITDENSIGNLTLLDSGTNREYQNELYAYKRKVIIEKDKEDIFIPLCTKNVFLKYYSKEPKTLMTWTNDDAEDYANCIEAVLREDGLCK